MGLIQRLRESFFHFYLSATLGSSFFYLEHLSFGQSGPSLHRLVKITVIKTEMVPILLGSLQFIDDSQKTKEPLRFKFLMVEFQTL